MFSYYFFMKTKWSGKMLIPFVVAAVLATMVGIAGVTTDVFAAAPGHGTSGASGASGGAGGTGAGGAPGGLGGGIVVCVLC
jgi:hypothetical protein